MRPTFQIALEDLKQTSILRLEQIHKCNKKVPCSICLTVFSLFLELHFSLNPDLRAVEFFIRDKYEKKKYYSKNVTNGTSVCID